LAVVFFLTNYPILSELVTNEKGFVGPPVYEKATGPLWLLLVLLMGIAPLTMWYRSSLNRLGKAGLWPVVVATISVVGLIVLQIGNWASWLGFWVVIFSSILTVIEFWKGTRARMKRGESVLVAFSNLMARNRRRYGGYWIHIGVLVMAVGIIGVEMFQQETQIRLDSGQSATLGRYEMVFNEVTRYPGPDDLLITEANLDVRIDGRTVATLTPRTELYTRTGQPMTIPDARSTIFEDFYVLLINWEPTSANSATFRIYLNPLINWVWAGGFIFVFGTLVAAWPDKQKETVARRSRHVAIGTAD
jgi:cytochrome c-type biogenesis protein CcmF